MRSWRTWIERMGSDKTPSLRCSVGYVLNEKDT
jgi:hypothetical protein